MSSGKEVVEDSVVGPGMSKAVTTGVLSVLLVVVVVFVVVVFVVVFVFFERSIKSHE